MRRTIEIVKNVQDLPDGWDGLTSEYFQTKEFLHHAAQYNPCKQRYYLLSEDSILKAGAVVYSLRIDLFTYLSVKSPFTMHIVGIPCSVSVSGLVGSTQFLSFLLDKIKEKERGLQLILNLDTETLVEGMTKGRTLPTINLTNRFSSFEEYTSSLRAHYRRRLIQTRGAFAGVETVKMDCRKFNAEMYAQYLAVLKRSQGKLETLSLEFFQQLPSSFNLSAFYQQNNLLGWTITIQHKQKSYFFLSGIDYNINGKYQTYFNMLLEVLRQGIESKSEVIDFGQTAETPKLRLGGSIEEKLMFAYHSNPLFRLLLKEGKKVLEYSTISKETHVFK